MKARELMTRDPVAVTPNDSVRHAAELMRSIEVGALPVVHSAENRVLLGIVTDRDIVVRCVAEGHGATCAVKAHMTSAPLETVEAADDESAVVEKMERAQVRRVPVVDTDNRLVGIVAQADIARKLGPTEPAVVDEVLERVSAPVVTLQA